MNSIRPIRDLTGTAAYAGGMLDRRAGTLNPLAYVRGLAAAALHHGATIHGGVEVHRLRQHGRSWRADTSRGSLQADSVIVATNAYTDGLMPGVSCPVFCLYGAQSATRPLRELGHILPQRQGVSDVRKRFFRLDPENRLIIGGPAGLWPPSSGRSLPFAIIERALGKLFPELRAVPFDHRWIAKGAAAVDLLPSLRARVRPVRRARIRRPRARHGHRARPRAGPPGAGTAGRAGGLSRDIGHPATRARCAVRTPALRRTVALEFGPSSDWSLSIDRLGGLLPRRRRQHLYPHLDQPRGDFADQIYQASIASRENGSGRRAANLIGPQYGMFGTEMRPRRAAATMLQVAEMYDLLAKRAAEREARAI